MIAIYSKHSLSYEVRILELFYLMDLCIPRHVRIVELNRSGLLSTSVAWS